MEQLHNCKKDQGTTAKTKEYPLIQNQIIKVHEKL